MTGKIGCSSKGVPGTTESKQVKHATGLNGGCSGGVALGGGAGGGAGGRAESEEEAADITATGTIHMSA